MARPVVPPLAEQVYHGLAPLANGDEQRQWALLLLIGLLAQPFVEVDTLVGDSDIGEGWSVLFDTDRCPARWLPFQAALIGVWLPEGLDEAQQRIRIREVGGLQRGTPAAIKGIARQHLTGHQSTVFLERDGGAWRDTLITYSGETPDPAAVNAALQDPNVKPAGRKITHRVDPGWTVGEMEAAYSTRTVGDIEAAFPTVGDLESNIPA
jgi:hypothetical protein